MKHANISLFVPHQGCPHQCSFCNQKTISGSVKELTPQEVRETLQKAVGDGVDPKNTEIAFFGGSFTAIRRDYMISLLEEAKPFIENESFCGIRISTRPDAIDDEILSILKEYKVTSIELGAQSTDEQVLLLNHRGHTSDDIIKASRLIKEKGFFNFDIYNELTQFKTGGKTLSFGSGGEAMLMSLKKYMDPLEDKDNYIKMFQSISDENGTAKIAINLNPGNYTIKTIFNRTTVENTITVLPTLIADNLVKYFRNDSQFYIDLIDGEGNPVSGVNITMNINGVFYNRTTNENGTARLNINLNPGEYILTAIDPLTGLQMSYNITVLPTLNATDLEMKYKDGSTFNVTVLDGQGNPLKEAAVTFNINGVFYTRYSDSNGIARLNINLMAGEYIITSEYDGMRIANTITIKD